MKRLIIVTSLLLLASLPVMGQVPKTFNKVTAEEWLTNKLATSFPDLPNGDYSFVRTKLHGGVMDRYYERNHKALDNYVTINEYSVLLKELNPESLQIYRNKDEVDRFYIYATTTNSRKIVPIYAYEKGQIPKMLVRESKIIIGPFDLGEPKIEDRVKQTLKLLIGSYGGKRDAY